MWGDLQHLSFWSAARNQNLKLEVWKPGCAFCLLLTQAVAKTNYAICHFLRLLQSFQFLVTSSCSWTQYHLRQPTRSRLGPTKTQCWLKCEDLCSMHGWLSLESKGGVQQNWRRQELSVQDVCVLWDATVVLPPPGREWVIQKLREIHVHSGIAIQKACHEHGGRAWMQTCEPMPSVSQVDPQN